MLGLLLTCYDIIKQMNKKGSVAIILEATTCNSSTSQHISVGNGITGRPPVPLHTGSWSFFFLPSKPVLSFAMRGFMAVCRLWKRVGYSSSWEASSCFTLCLSYARKKYIVLRQIE